MTNKTGSFTGTVKFDEKENSIYYNWRLVDHEGQLIAGKSLNVALQEIRIGQDEFEITKEYATEGIKKYRIGRERIILELSVS